MPPPNTGKSFPANPSAGTPAIPHRSPKRQWPLFRASRQVKWTAGVSSRPERHPLPHSQPAHLLAKLAKMFALLSNPAGELLPLYNRLTPHQMTLVGYGLAISANVIFVLGATLMVSSSNGLVASWFWASGAVTFVTMVATIAIARTVHRARSSWVADIFILGTAMVPLSLSVLTMAIARLYILNNVVLFLVVVASALMWAFSSALLTINYGLTRIHRFSPQMAAWFTPVVLASGLCGGACVLAMMSAGS